VVQSHVRPRAPEEPSPPLFDALAQRFTRIFQGLGSGRLTEKGIEEGIREVRKALLEADVNLGVVKSFVARVREKALGAERW
jgi:signal recognition particle subunit SRP54